ncbi:MAG: DNA repair protein RadA [Desulfovibrio sp.]|nr:MAG: DNA repair protein RadA [Desulfovibrio sp.]
MKDKRVFICSSCGARSITWRGQCPTCKEWNTLAETRETKPAKGGLSSRAPRLISQADPIPVSEIDTEAATPFSTGLASLDTLLGQGLKPGGALLLGGAPGIGKSTLLLQLAAMVAKGGGTSVYVSGEEAPSQLKERAERLDALHDSLLALATTRVEDALAVLEQGKADLLIIDSIQTMHSDLSDGLPGSVSQVRASAAQLIETAKAHSVCLVLVGHVTKDGQIAGPKLLEHMVDTVLSLEGDRRHLYRMLRVLKNRYGPSHELMVFEMAQEGMKEVDDPSTLFLEARDTSLSGTALVMAVDGQRPFAVEVQALVSRSYLSIPRRTGLGFDVNRLHLLLAVLEKRLNLDFGSADVYVKIGGGVRMQDPGLDLGLVAAVLSSLYDRALPEKAVLWGEVDLNGQVRPVQAQEVRFNQAKRLGFSRIFSPDSDSGGDRVATLARLGELAFAGPKTV